MLERWSLSYEPYSAHLRCPRMHHSKLKTQSWQIEVRFHKGYCFWRFKHKEKTTALFPLDWYTLSSSSTKCNRDNPSSNAKTCQSGNLWNYRQGQRPLLAHSNSAKAQGYRPERSPKIEVRVERCTIPIIGDLTRD